MSAFIVVNLILHDSSWRAEYRANVPAIVSKFGGEYVAASERIEIVEGSEPAPDMMAILKFPSLSDLKSFLSDDGYRPYKQARLAGSTSTMAIFEM
jgi:uncharacterized protein (DUF1330 family)